jgi:hypothetical protein
MTADLMTLDNNVQSDFLSDTERFRILSDIACNPSQEQKS